jgi:hypothetical protein
MARRSQEMTIMDSDRIEFISAYCDRWCERCAFTARCSAHAVHVATAMCDGDFEQALELALGSPRSPDRADAPDWYREVLQAQPTRAELDEQSRLEEARHARIEQEPLTTLAPAVMHLTVAWLKAHRHLLRQTATGELAGAAEVLGWDSGLIGAKIHRAMDGRDRSWQDETDDDPIQNDWNGSAKVALISIARSAAACDVLAATRDTEAARLGEELRNLGRQVHREFPNALRFIRPGFDTDTAPPRTPQDARVEPDDRHKKC